MKKRRDRVEEHFGYPVLREEGYTKIARVPVKGNWLLQSILLHPRYVPHNTSHQIMTERFYHRGRTIDIFLDEPIELHGEKYSILNFKGVGADADHGMIIHPTRWYLTISGVGLFGNKWVPREYADAFERVWGALTVEDAYAELSETILKEGRIKCVPYIAVNIIPSDIERRIQQVENGNAAHRLCQIVRAQKTNIRTSDPYKIDDRRRCSYLDPKEIARIDAAVIATQLNLAKQGKMMTFVGSIYDNRFIDGSFTDLENYHIRKLNLTGAISFIQQVVNSSFFHILPPRMHEDYTKELDQKTGLPFKRLLNKDYISLEKLFGIIDGELNKTANLLPANSVKLV